MPKPTDPRVSKSISFRADHAERLDKEAADRLVSPALIVEKALDAFLDGLAPPLAPEVAAAAAPTPPSEPKP